LADVLVVELGLDPSIVKANYDSATRELTYHVSFNELVASLSASLDLGTLDLGSLASIGVTGGTINLDATVGADFVFGVVLQAAKSEIVGTIDAPANGQISGGLAFALQLDAEAPVNITVAGDATNNTIDDLVADINAAITLAGLGEAVVAGRQGDKIKFSTRGADTGREIILTATAGNPILDQLGFTNGQSDEFDLTQQFFIENASLAASVDLVAKDIDAGAKFGFIGIGIDGGSGNAVASVGMDLYHPDAPATESTTSALIPNHPRRLSLGDMVSVIQQARVSDVIRPPKIGSATVETALNTSIRALNQMEAAIAVDPKNPNRVFVASNSNNLVGGSPAAGLFAAYSTDSGSSWTRTLIATGDDSTAACCDPTVVFDKFGNLYLAYVNTVKDTVVVLKSIDGGQNFTPLKEFVDSPKGPEMDQPTLTTGPSATDPNAATVWIAYQSSGGNLKTAGLTVTKDAIGDFSTPTVIAGSLEGNFVDIAIGPKGQVAVAWERAVKVLPQEKEGIIYFNIDPDGLGPANFGTAKQVRTNINVGPKEKIPAQPNRGFSSNVDLAYDTSGGKRRGRLYLIYTDEKVDEQHDTDINLIYSDNDGQSWSNIVRVNDDTGAASQFLPKMAVDPQTGNIAVVWHDTRTDTVGNDEAKFFGAVSTDGGASFKPNFEIGTLLSDQSKANPSAAFSDLDFGDYTGVDFYAGKIYAAWADVVTSGTTSDFDVFTSRISVSPSGTSSATSSLTAAAAGLSDLFSFTGSINFVLPVKLTADFLTIPSDASIVLDWPDVTKDFDPSKNLKFNGLESLTDLKDLDFNDIMAALRAVLGYLRQLQGFAVLDAEIPLLDRSLNDLLDYADGFAAKVEQLQQNEQGTLQELQTYIRSELGLPLTLSLDTADATKKALKIELDQSVGYDGGPLNLNLELPEPAKSFVGADLDAELDVTANAGLGLDLGIDLNTLAPFLYGSSNVTLGARVAADLDFSATLLGLIGVFVRGGDVTFDRDGLRATPQPAELRVGLKDPSARYAFADIDLGGASSDVDVTLDAALKATLPIFAPTPTDKISTTDHTLDINLSHTGAFDGTLDLTNAIDLPDWDLNALIDSLDFTGDLSSLLNGIHTLLGFVKQGLESEVLSKKLPLVGDKLKSGAAFIESVRNAIQALNNESDNSYATIQTRLAQVLGPLVNSVTITPTVTTTDHAEYLIRLNKSVTLNPQFDLNLPALGLDLTGNVQAALVFDFALGIGVTRTGGVYIKTDANGAQPEINVDLNITMPGTQLTGKLGFLKVKINDEDDHAGGRPSTTFTGDFAVDLVDPNGGDNRFSLLDLQNGPAFGDVVKAKLTADADVRLEMSIDFGDATKFPSFTTDFDLDWSYGNVATNVGDSSFGSIDRIAFQNVQLSLGSYLSGFAAPIINQIKSVLSPLRPMIDFLSKEIDALASIGSVRDFFDDAPNGNNDDKVTVGEVIKKLSLGTPALKFIDAAKYILDLSVPTLGANVAISLGGFNLSPSIRTKANLVGENPSSITAPGTSITQQLQNLSDQTVKTFFNNLKNDNLGGTTAAGDRGKPSFPLLEQPTTAFKLIMGQDVDMFTWEMPRFEANLFIEKDFPILGPLEVHFFGGVGVAADIGIGYDTTGLRRAINGDLGALGEGFYLNDHITRGVDGQIVNDDPEIFANGTIGIGLGVDVIIAEGRLDGAIDGNLLLNFNDPNPDGKIRIAELTQNFNKGPLAIFDIDGELIARLTGSLSVGVWPFEKTWSKNFLAKKLLDFSVSGGGGGGGQSDPNTGTVQLDGTLVLATFDGVNDSILVTHVSGTAAGENVNVTAKGTTTLFTGVRKILANPTTGDDVIFLATGVLVPAELHGGDGKDTLTGSGGPNTMTGGLGDDRLVTRGSGDHISGDEGNDNISAGAGNDSASGGAGNDTVDGENDNDSVLGDDGNDSLVGGAGKDSLYGGKGNDTIKGGADDDRLVGDEDQDSLLGEAGADTALGGDGNDRVSGGADNDSLQGDNGNDTLTGEAGDDVLDGGGPPPRKFPKDGIFLPPDIIGGITKANATKDTTAVSATAAPIVIIDRNERIKSPYFTVTQGGGDDVVIGGAGADILRDAGANNILVGDYDETV
jgi:Ca2+-binding RTX toxin-like protein